MIKLISLSGLVTEKFEAFTIINFFSTFISLKHYYLFFVKIFICILLIKCVIFSLMLRLFYKLKYVIIKFITLQIVNRYKIPDFYYDNFPLHIILLESEGKEKPSHALRNRCVCATRLPREFMIVSCYQKAFLFQTSNSSQVNPESRL